MAILLSLAKFSPAATRGLIDQGPDNRESYFRKMVEDQGGKVLGYYFAEGGEWDVVSILDFPDEMLGAAGVATILASQANGLWSEARQIRLHSSSAVQDALGRATALRLPGSESD